MNLDGDGNVAWPARFDESREQDADRSVNAEAAKFRSPSPSKSTTMTSTTSSSSWFSSRAGWIKRDPRGAVEQTDQA